MFKRMIIFYFFSSMQVTWHFLLLKIHCFPKARTHCCGFLISSCFSAMIKRVFGWYQESTEALCTQSQGFSVAGCETPAGWTLSALTFCQLLTSKGHQSCLSGGSDSLVSVGTWIPAALRKPAHGFHDVTAQTQGSVTIAKSKNAIRTIWFKNHWFGK